MAKFIPLETAKKDENSVRNNTIRANKTPRLKHKFSPGFRQIFQKFTKTYYFSHFATEILLLLILCISVGVNLFYQASSIKGASDQSLFFSYLKKHPSWNQKLVEAYESVDVYLSSEHNLTKQILAASVQEKKEESLGTEEAPLPTLSGSTLLKPNPAGTHSSYPKHDIEVYQVRGGDTLARIASSYGVSVDTILWENNLASANLIRPGQELRILPTTGVKYTVKNGETLSSIAKKFDVDILDILDHNDIEIEEYIQVGDELIIPNGIKKTPPTPQRQQYLADLQKENYKKVDVPADYQGSGKALAWPLPAAHRISQYFARRHKAIDVPCRDCQVVAAADGIVELAGWQKGYGNTIVINHGNGLKTRYGHGRELLVSAGENVTQGQSIMISGSTGHSTGPHLHFEVKVNGQLVNPLSMTK